MTVDAVGIVQTVQPKKTGGSGKAWASTFIPGVGQFLDGRNGAGAGYMAANTAMSIGSFTLYKSFAEDVFKASKAAAATGASFDVSKYLKSLPKGEMYGVMTLSLALWIANIVDAYKGRKQV